MNTSIDISNWKLQGGVGQYKIYRAGKNAYKVIREGKLLVSCPQKSIAYREAAWLYECNK